MPNKYPKTAAAFAAAALATASPAQASFNDQFICDSIGDGDVIVAMDSRDSSKATVQYSVGGDSAGEEGSFTQTALKAEYEFPESGSKYSGGGYVFYTTNEAAMLVYGAGSADSGHVGCRIAAEAGDEEDEISAVEAAAEAMADAAEAAADATADAAGGGPAISIRAKSWGGKLRGGPGTEYAQVGSLAEGARVTLLQNTGVRWNGYDWFRIRTASGQEAFQWGGILCSDALHVIGIYQPCM